MGPPSRPPRTVTMTDNHDPHRVNSSLHCLSWLDLTSVLLKPACAWQLPGRLVNTYSWTGSSISSSETLGRAGIFYLHCKSFQVILMPVGQRSHLENTALYHKETVLNTGRDAGRERLSVTVPGKGQCVHQVALSTWKTASSGHMKMRDRRVQTEPWLTTRRHIELNPAKPSTMLIGILRITRKCEHFMRQCIFFVYFHPSHIPSDNGLCRNVSLSLLHARERGTRMLSQTWARCPRVAASPRVQPVGAAGGVQSQGWG